jgi:hypothetical protein
VAEKMSDDLKIDPYYLPQGILLAPPEPRADGLCMAEGCERKQTARTLFGYELCDDHFSDFYSDVEVRFKDGTF